MRKAISIPIHTLVMLAIAIIVMLAVIAWFMGGFSGPGGQVNAQQRFNSKCIDWAESNCARPLLQEYIPSDVCNAYKDFKGLPDDWNCQTEDHYEMIASACGCTAPYGTGQKCGNGRVEGDEECDNGNNNIDNVDNLDTDCYGEVEYCTTNCRIKTANCDRYCGDGTCQSEEDTTTCPDDCS